MRYQPTLDLGDSFTYNAVAAGKLKPQPGQWVKINAGDKPSRWAGLRSSGSLVAAHPRGQKGASLKRLRELIAYAKG